MNRDRTDPDTLEFRNLRALRDWRYKMRTGFKARDPLTLRERIDAQYELACKRLDVLAWMKARRIKNSAPLRPLRLVR